MVRLRRDTMRHRTAGGGATLRANLGGRMKPDRDEMPQVDEEHGSFELALDRRQLLKIGAGVVSTAIAAPAAAQQSSAGRSAASPGSMRQPGEISPMTGPGYKNDFNRVGHNGPMDDTTRKVVKFVSEFKASQMTPAATRAFNRTMVDSIASLIAGFEEEPCRIAARVARLYPAGSMKCTILGYGIETT